MTRRFYVLVAAAAALGLALCLLRAGKTPKPVPPESKRLLPQGAASSTLREPEPAVNSSRVHGLFVAVLVLCVATSVGVGAGSEVDAGNRVSTAGAAAIAQHQPSRGLKALLADEAPSRAARQEAAKAEPVLASPTPPAPTPAPATEAPVTPPPPPPPPETPAPVIEMPPDGIEALICALPWPCAEAISVASCESGTDLYGRLDGSWASNGSNYGLFQINAVHAYRWPDFYDAWMDPARNTQWAFEIWSISGWGPWACRPY